MTTKGSLLKPKKNRRDFDSIPNCCVINQERTHWDNKSYRIPPTAIKQDAHRAFQSSRLALNPACSKLECRDLELIKPLTALKNMAAF